MSREMGRGEQGWESEEGARGRLAGKATRNVASPGHRQRSHEGRGQGCEPEGQRPRDPEASGHGQVSLPAPGTRGPWRPLPPAPVLSPRCWEMRARLRLRWLSLQLCFPKLP